MRSIAIIMVPVKNRQAAKAFYLKLGFQVTVEAVDPHGEAWIEMGLPGSATTISLAAFPAIIYETGDIEKESELLREKGIVTGNMNETPWGKFAWLKDPDGNSLCLHQKNK